MPDISFGLSDVIECAAVRPILTPDECRALDRCEVCCWHVETQSHHPDCPRRGKKRA